MNSQEPTEAERSGNFAGVGTIIDPLTKLPFPNNQIPTSRLNPVDVNLQNLLFPLPTAPGIGTNTFELVPYVSTATRYAVRIDHKLSESNQLRFTYLRMEVCLRAILWSSRSIATTSLMRRCHRQCWQDCLKRSTLIPFVSLLLPGTR